MKKLIKVLSVLLVLSTTTAQAALLDLEGNPRFRCISCEPPIDIG